MSSDKRGIPCADGRQLSVLERSDYGNHRQHKAMTASRPFADGRHFSASERIDDGKHFTAPNSGKHRPIVGVSQRFRRKHFTALAGEASTLMPAFHSAFARSITRPSRRKHQRVARWRLDHSPMGSITRRQSKSMTGSISVVLGVSTIRRWEAFLSVRANR